MTRNLLSYGTLGLGGAIGSGAVLSDDQVQMVIQLISALLTILVGALVRRYLPPRDGRPDPSNTPNGASPAESATDTTSETAPASQEARP